jgi:hypothetical protein
MFPQSQSAHAVNDRVRRKVPPTMTALHGAQSAHYFLASAASTALAVRWASTAAGKPQ